MKHMEHKTRTTRPRGSRQIRRELRAGKLVWGYHVWLRQPDGSRKQVRDFSFNTKEEAKEALRAIQTASRQERYGLIPRKNYITTIETAITRFKELAQAKRTLRRRGKATDLTKQPSYFRTLDSFNRWAATERKTRYVCEVGVDTLHYWIAAEVISADPAATVRRSTIKRRLNTILTALGSAKESGKFDDLAKYSVPTNPLQ